ncbi:ACP S-malonyltransferase [Nocardia altamirensis]|uniref:ACP S-malonyltransferase n=1 Tax=Nocardia altamirensis TaxID=472158 RepID=UPI0009FD534F|nr:ACP S-malonyltransferase [Nocardia altamirensis]
MPVFVFPGQGSQFPGMGLELFDEFPEIVREAEAVLGYSVREVCVEPGGARLAQTRYAQPAIYAVNVLTYLRFQRRSAVRPSYLLGHSLGEYCALFAAGVVDFATGLRLVALRGALMAEAEDGAMAAVVGLTAEQVEATAATWPGGGLWVANLNTPDQVVISGGVEPVRAAREHFLAAGATRYVVLPVSGAFHSPLMATAQAGFAAVLADAPLHALRIPVVANLTGAPHTDAGLRDSLAAQICGPVRWADSIRLLLDRGETRFIETGARRVLTPMIEKIAS